jgi:hypothetical protein
LGRRDVGQRTRVATSPLCERHGPRRAIGYDRFKVSSGIDILDFAALDQAPLCRDPYEHVVVAGFVRPEGAAAIGRDFPRIADAGSYPIENVTFGPTVETFWQELQGDAFRERIARKFGVDLAGHPLMATVREHV